VSTGCRVPNIHHVLHTVQSMRSPRCCFLPTHAPFNPSAALCSLTLASISIALLLLFLGLWIYFITRAYQRILKLNYAENRLANISIRIQVGAPDGCVKLAFAVSFTMCTRLDVVNLHRSPLLM
jgi:hypothetical protein